MSRFPPSMPEQTLCKQHQRAALAAEQRRWMLERAAALAAEEAEAKRRGGGGAGEGRGEGDGGGGAVSRSSDVLREPSAPEEASAGRTAGGEGAGAETGVGGLAPDHPLPDPDLDMELLEMNSFLERVETDLCRSDADSAR